MKRFIFTLLAVCAVSAGAQAQSLLDIVKKAATDAADKATGGKLTEMAIIGTWTYSSPAVKLEGGDLLADAGGAVLSSTIESKLSTIYQKVGIKPGMCTITFGNDGTFSMPVKSKTVNGTYVFNASTHEITLTIGKVGSFTGKAYISGTNLQLVFPVDKFVGFAATLGSKISALSSVTALLEKYKNANLGFGFAK